MFYALVYICTKERQRWCEPQRTPNNIAIFFIGFSLIKHLYIQRDHFLELINKNT